MEGPHPAATASTTKQAREARSEAESFAVQNPDVVHRATDQLLSEHGPERDRLLRQGYEGSHAAFERGDWEVATLSIDPDDFVLRLADFEHWVQDVEETYEGVEGFIEVVSLLREVWSKPHVSLEDVIDVGPNRLLVLLRLTGEGTGSGVPLDWTYTELHEYRQGRLVRQTVWLDREAAFREVGLPRSQP